MRIRFDKIDGFIKIYDGIRYLIILDHDRLYKIWDSIKCAISEKSVITESINNDFARIRIGSYNSFPIEKILIFDNVRILVKSVVNKNKNKYYFIIFLEKGLYKNKSNTEYLFK